MGGTAGTGLSLHGALCIQPVLSALRDVDWGRKDGCDTEDLCLTGAAPHRRTYTKNSESK